MNARRYTYIAIAIGILCTAGIWAQDAAPKQDVLTLQSDKVSIVFNIESIAQAIYGHNAFWGLAQKLSPDADYPINHLWAEGYVRPAVTLSYRPVDWLTLYGGTSLILSGTLGTDYFQYGSAAAAGIGSAYLGAKFTLKFPGLSIEMSGGKRKISIGNSFIISGGGANGNDRGGLTLAPYTAWNMSAALNVTYKDFALTALYLEKDQLPSEVRANIAPDVLAGFNAIWSASPSSFFGFAYLHVLRSDSPYPQPIVGTGVIPGARKGLNVFDLYWKYETYQGILAGFSFLGEAVIEYNPHIPNTDGLSMLAVGTGIDIGYRFLMLPFTPKLSYSPRYCSGDNPDTKMYERFDGLYWDGSPSGWGAGVNAALGFLNSNLLVQRVKLELNFTPNDILNFSYYYVMAAQTNSPIQFGQATRPGSSSDGQLNLLVGVSNPAISHDLYLEYIHVFNPHWILTCGASFSFPLAGIKDLVPDYKDWIGGIITLLFKY